jgi:hypothetical protein
MPGVNGFRAGFMGQILMGVLNGLSVPVKGIEITCAVVPEIENQITAYQLSGHWVVQRERIFRVSRRSKNFPIAEIESAGDLGFHLEEPDSVPVIRQAQTVFQNGQGNPRKTLKPEMRKPPHIPGAAKSCGQKSCYPVFKTGYCSLPF